MQKKIHTHQKQIKYNSQYFTLKIKQTIYTALQEPSSIHAAVFFWHEREPCSKAHLESVNKLLDIKTSERKLLELSLLSNPIISIALQQSNSIHAAVFFWHEREPCSKAHRRQVNKLLDIKTSEGKLLELSLLSQNNKITPLFGQSKKKLEL